MIIWKKTMIIKELELIFLKINILKNSLHQTACVLNYREILTLLTSERPHKLPRQRRANRKALKRGTISMCQLS